MVVVVPFIVVVEVTATVVVDTTGGAVVTGVVVSPQHTVWTVATTGLTLLAKAASALISTTVAISLDTETVGCENPKIIPSTFTELPVFILIVTECPFGMVANTGTLISTDLHTTVIS